MDCKPFLPGAGADLSVKRLRFRAKRAAPDSAQIPQPCKLTILRQSTDQPPTYSQIKPKPCLKKNELFLQPVPVLFFFFL